MILRFHHSQCELHIANVLEFFKLSEESSEINACGVNGLPRETKEIKGNIISHMILRLSTTSTR